MKFGFVRGMYRDRASVVIYPDTDDEMERRAGQTFAKMIMDQHTTEYWIFTPIKEVETEINRIVSMHKDKIEEESFDFVVDKKLHAPKSLFEEIFNVT